MTTNPSNSHPCSPTTSVNVFFISGLGESEEFEDETSHYCWPNSKTQGIFEHFRRRLGLVLVESQRPPGKTTTDVLKLIPVE